MTLGATAAKAALTASGRAVVVCDQWLGSNGYAGMKAMRRAGWAVEVVPEWEFVPVKWRSAAMRALAKAVRPLAVREFNRELMLQVTRLEPELLLVFKGTFVTEDTLRHCASLGVRQYCFFPDVSFRTHGRYLPTALPLYDWVFTTKSFGLEDMRAQLGVGNASLLMHGFDRDLHRPVPLSGLDRERYECDVSFIGKWSPKKEGLIALLLDRLPTITVKVWGELWDQTRSPAVRRIVGGHGLYGEEFVRAICASRINLGLLSERTAGASSGDRITSRTFHIPACGGFLLHERTEEVSQIFAEGRHFAGFGGPDELVTSVQHYLRNETDRRRIAEEGHRLVATRDSWDDRVKQIIERHRALQRRSVHATDLDDASRVDGVA